MVHGVPNEVNTEPTNLLLNVDGQTVRSPYFASWLAGSVHTIGAPSPQSLGPTRHVFSRWSNGGAQTHTITTQGPSTFTAIFETQHQLSAVVSPPAGGLLTVSPASADGFYNAGTPLVVTAQASSGYAFAGFSGALSGNANPQALVMTAPQTLTASFNCTYALSSTSMTSPGAGGGGTVALTTGAGCTWTATSAVAWIAVQNASGTGNANVTFIVAPNPGLSPRTGTLTINGLVLTVVQASAACSYQVEPTALTIPANGGTSTVSVISTPNCAWEAVSQSSWVTIGSGATGAGNGTVTVQVAPNTGAVSRSGVMAIAGQTVAVNQSGSAVQPQSTGLRFTPLAPCRVMETRPEYNFEGRTGAFGPPYLRAGETRTLTLGQSNVCAAPAMPWRMCSTSPSSRADRRIS
ncbi:MAG: BACON domain-containing protein [Bryobacterales bacterium]|nr:BACON domain-containing protein [Bryobacterales bacterium]